MLLAMEAMRLPGYLIFLKPMQSNASSMHTRHAPFFLFRAVGNLAIMRRPFC